MRVTLTTKFDLPTVLGAFPARSWVTAREVLQALDINGSDVGVGHVLGSLGLTRTCVRVGEKVQRVWLLRGHPRDFCPADVRAELVANNSMAVKEYRKGATTSRVVSLTKLRPKAQETPFLSP